MDLNLSQTEWNNIFKRWGILIRIWSWLKGRIHLKMIADRIIGEGGGYPHAINLDENFFFPDQGETCWLDYYSSGIAPDPVSSVISGFFIQGVKLGVNTDDDGRLYFKYTTATKKISVYSNYQFSSLVIEGTHAGTGRKIVTLTEQNSSGLSGQVAIDSDTLPNGSIWSLVCRPDWKRRFSTEFDEQTPEDVESLTPFLARLNIDATTIESMISDWQNLIETEFIQSYLKQKMQSPEISPILVTQTQSDGTVTITYAGILKALYDNMNDNSTPQKVRANQVKATSAVAGPDNVGKGTVAISLLEHAKPGYLTIKCTNEVLGSEFFEIKWRPLSWWTFPDRTANYRAYVGKAHQDNVIGISSLVISRTIDEFNDGQGVYSNWSFSGESSDNTEDGKLYIKYTTSGDITEVYSDSARQNLVARGTGTGAVTLAEQNASGLSGSVDVVHKGSDDADIYVDLNQFRIGDRFTSSIVSKGKAGYTNDGSPEYLGGMFQKYLSEVYSFSLPSVDKDETIADYFPRRG